VYAGVDSNDIIQYIDEESHKQGWVYFTSRPGDHEFWFLSPVGMSQIGAGIARKHAPHYQFTIPRNSEVVYIGTFVIPLVKHHRGAAWGGVQFNPHEAMLTNEKDLAHDLIRNKLPEFQKFAHVEPVEKEEEPMIIRRPE